MKKIIIYSKELIFINGIYTWVINLCRLLNEDYDILVLSKKYSTKVRNDIAKYVSTDIYREDKEYSADTLIFNFTFDQIPNNLKHINSYTILHCDYSKIGTELEIDWDTKYLAVSETAAKGFSERYGISCKSIESVIPNDETNRILHLVSCTRMLSHKGAERIYQLANLFDMCGVKYIWLNFSDKDIITAEFMNTHYNPRVIQMPAVSNEDLRDFIKDSDYLVQLSNHEGYCFAVHEALTLGTPVIVTDIPIFDELVINGVNGYKVDLNMENIDVNEIAYKHPTEFKKYKQDVNEIKSKWVEIL